MSQTCRELIKGNVESFADTEQGGHSDRPSRLDHLPVPDAEPVGNHILLAELAICPVRPDSVAQGSKESHVPGR